MDPQVGVDTVSALSTARTYLEQGEDSNSDNSVSPSIISSRPYNKSKAVRRVGG